MVKTKKAVDILDSMQPNGAQSLHHISAKVNQVPNTIKRKVIAVDFDGCLCDDIWPDIGAPHKDVINKLLEEQRNGTALILWTCRCGKLLEDAVIWCKNRGLVFDAINEALPERIAAYNNDSRKVGADEYWDDKAVKMPDSIQTQVYDEHVKELLQAEKEGRLLVLPCKVGDTVYAADAKPVIPLSVVSFGMWLKGSDGEDWESFENIGETVFLSRKDAEEKLIYSY